MMEKRYLYTLLVSSVVFLATNQAVAVPSNFSFTGTFAQDDDVQLFNFTADGASTVTLRSYSYAGGTQANGNVVTIGGFDPILALFDATGVLIAQQDDDPNDNGICDGNSDPNTGACFDTFFNQILAAGSYMVAITQFDNFATGPTLSDGFARQGQGNFTGTFGCTNGAFCDVSGVDPFNNRTNAWAFDILNVETASQVPEPATVTLLGLGLAVLFITRHRCGKPKTSKLT